MERPDRDKHARLFGLFINYVSKKFYNIRQTYMCFKLYKPVLIVDEMSVGQMTVDKMTHCHHKTSLTCNLSCPELVMLGAFKENKRILRIFVKLRITAKIGRKVVIIINNLSVVLQNHLKLNLHYKLILLSPCYTLFLAPRH
jgi:hypothetical protein